MVDLLVATIAGLCVDTVQLKHTFTQVTDQMDKNILPAVGVGTFKYLDCLYR